MENNQVPDYIVYDPQQNQNLKTSASTSANYEEYEDECTFIQTFTFVNGNNRKTKQLSPYHPKNEHLVVAPGLNLKAKCKNQKCRAFQHGRTWIRLGYGTCNLPQDLTDQNCKGCGREIEFNSIKSIGFTKTTITMKGRIKVNGKIEKCYKSDQETQGKVVYFCDDKKEDLSQFIWLKIATTKLK